MKRVHFAAWLVVLLLAGCGKEALPPLLTSAPATATSRPAATDLPPTVTSAAPTETPIPAPTQDPTFFGAIGVTEIRAYAIESVANAIFVKTMDALKSGGAIQDFQVIRVTAFPGDMSFLAEVTFNVQTTDPAWLADGGTPAADNWINEKCYRFDFMANATEYQLRNKRLCG